MKKLYDTLTLFLECGVGVFKARPDLYAMQSATWYLPLKIQGIVTAEIAVIVLAAMWLVRKNINKKG